jgi:hypothetical protein
MDVEKDFESVVRREKFLVAGLPTRIVSEIRSLVTHLGAPGGTTPNQKSTSF